MWGQGLDTEQVPQAGARTPDLLNQKLCGNPQAVSEQVILVSRVLKPRLGKYLSFSEPQVP